VDGAAGADGATGAEGRTDRSVGGVCPKFGRGVSAGMGCRGPAGGAVEPAGLILGEGGTGRAGMEMPRLNAGPAWPGVASGACTAPPMGGRSGRNEGAGFSGMGASFALSTATVSACCSSFTTGGFGTGGVGRPRLSGWREV